MNKNYINTPMLNEVLSRRKVIAEKKFKMQLIACGIVGMIMTIMWIKQKSDPIDFLGCWLFPAIFAALDLGQYKSALMKKERMKRILNLYNADADCVLENNLQKSEQLDEYVYLSDEYIFDFYLGQAAKLSEVSSVKKYSQMDVKGYAISIFWNLGARQFILFKTKQQRAEAIEKINDAVSRAKKKYGYSG